MAICCIQVPTSEMPWPTKKSRKLRCPRCVPSTSYLPRGSSWLPRMAEAFSLDGKIGQEQVGLWVRYAHSDWRAGGVSPAQTSITEEAKSRVVSSPARRSVRPANPVPVGSLSQQSKQHAAPLPRITQASCLWSVRLDPLWTLARISRGLRCGWRLHADIEGQFVAAVEVDEDFAIMNVFVLAGGSLWGVRLPIRGTMTETVPWNSRPGKPSRVMTAACPVLTRDASSSSIKARTRRGFKSAIMSSGCWLSGLATSPGSA